MNHQRINKLVEETERLYVEWRLSPGMERKIPSLIEEKQFMYEKFAELIVKECALHLHKRGVEGFGILEERNLKEHFGVEE